MSFNPKVVNYPNLLAGQLKITADDPAQFGVYSTGTVQKFPLGTRCVDGDRRYRYGHTVAAVGPSYGAKNVGVYNSITNGVVTARNIGDMWFDILLDGTTGLATWFGKKNNMVGGHMVMATGDPTQQRKIVGHEKGGDTATIKVYMDGPFTRDIVATQMVEIIQNPYANLNSVNNVYSSVMGIPTTNIADDSYGWFQTWGPCWVVPALPVADSPHWREVVFGGDGSIKSAKDAHTDLADAGFQLAGYVIDNTFGAIDNPPFIFLQISP